MRPRPVKFRGVESGDIDAVRRLVSTRVRAGVKVLMRDQGDQVLVNEA